MKHCMHFFNSMYSLKQAVCCCLSTYRTGHSACLPVFVAPLVLDVFFAQARRGRFPWRVPNHVRTDDASLLFFSWALCTSCSQSSWLHPSRQPWWTESFFVSLERSALVIGNRSGVPIFKICRTGTQLFKKGQQSVCHDLLHMDVCMSSVTVG